MGEMFDIAYEQIGILKELWEKNRQFHENTSEYFKAEYHDISFSERIKGFNKIDKENLKITVVKSNNEYVAYCISLIDGDKGELQSLHVDEENRENGIGREIVAKHLEWMNEKQCKVIGVTVSQENVVAIKFYKQLGFYPNTLYMQQK